MLLQGSEQKLWLFQNQNRCPYLSDREQVTHFFAAPTLSSRLYETLLSKGFRRSGHVFYQNHCPTCRACIPIRVDVRRFTESRSQRRVLRKNRDVRIICHSNMFREEDFFLYRSYCEQRHPSSPIPNQEDYIRFLIASPLPTEIMRYYLDDRLVGLAWIDIMPHSLSSVYFCFDTKYSSLSLGTFSVLKQVELCALRGKDWLYLGFWIKERQNMAYKNRFKPCEILINETWKEYDESSRAATYKF